MIDVEGILTSNFPKQVKFLARDENGELWALAKEPIIKEDKQGKYLVFGGLTGFGDLDKNDAFSLAVYNHLFQGLKNLEIMELNK